MSALSYAITYLNKSRFTPLGGCVVTIVNYRTSNGEGLPPYSIDEGKSYVHEGLRNVRALHGCGDDRDRRHRRQPGDRGRGMGSVPRDVGRQLGGDPDQRGHDRQLLRSLRVLGGRGGPGVAGRFGLLGPQLQPERSRTDHLDELLPAAGRLRREQPRAAHGGGHP